MKIAAFRQELRCMAGRQSIEYHVLCEERAASEEARATQSGRHEEWDVAQQELVPC